MTTDAQQLTTSGCYRGFGCHDQDWRWKQDCHDPGYYVHPGQPQGRFAHPTAPEHERPPLTLLPLNNGILRFMAMCVNLRVVSIENLRQLPHLQPSIQNCALVDDEDFLAGIVEIFLLPSKSHSCNTFNAADSSFALRLTEESTKEDDNPLQMIALFRFTGSANTEEYPHLNALPTTDPRFDDVDRFDNHYHPASIEQIRSSDLSVSDYKIEGADDHIWTYDPRRYQPNKYYPFYKVLLIEYKAGVAHRLGIGQVHVDAFHHAQPDERLVALR